MSLYPQCPAAWRRAGAETVPTPPRHCPTREVFQLLPTPIVCPLLQVRHSPSWSKTFSPTICFSSTNNNLTLVTQNHPEHLPTRPQPWSDLLEGSAQARSGEPPRRGGKLQGIMMTSAEPHFRRCRLYTQCAPLLISS